MLKEWHNTKALFYQKNVLISHIALNRITIQIETGIMAEC